VFVDLLGFRDALALFQLGDRFLQPFPVRDQIFAHDMPDFVALGAEKLSAPAAPERPPPAARPRSNSAREIEMSLEISYHWRMAVAGGL